MIKYNKIDWIKIDNLLREELIFHKGIFSEEEFECIKNYNEIGEEALCFQDLFGELIKQKVQKIKMTTSQAKKIAIDFEMFKTENVYSGNFSWDIFIEYLSFLERNL